MTRIDQDEDDVLHERIREALVMFREERGWTQKEAAEALGWKRTTLCSIEKSRARPKMPRLQHILRTYGVSWRRFGTVLDAADGERSRRDLLLEDLAGVRQTLGRYARLADDLRSAAEVADQLDLLSEVSEEAGRGRVGGDEE